MPALHTVDLRGLKCPTPIVRINEEMRAVAAGEELVALANDRAFELDIKAWCRRTGHELLRCEVGAEDITVCIRKHAA